MSRSLLADLHEILSSVEDFYSFQCRFPFGYEDIRRKVSNSPKNDKK